MTAVDTTATFRPSLTWRAKQRTVTPHPRTPNRWEVSGEVTLGDSYPTYHVELPAGSKRYACSCHRHQYGEARAKGMCSHVLAVVLHRAATQARAKAIQEARARIARRQDVGEGGPASQPKLLAGKGAPANTGTLIATQEGAPPATPSPTDDRFGSPPLPDWVKSFRESQWDAVGQIIDKFESGAKAIFLDAPVGAGKTLIGELTRRLNKGQAVYVCTTKALQAQITRDFPYASVLQGRANYIPTGKKVNLWGEVSNNAGVQVTCADCTKVPGEGAGCRWCADVKACPYTVAKNEAIRNDLAVLNTAYWLTDSNLGSRKFTGRDLVIIDECDTLEQMLMGQVEVTISKARQRALELQPPSKKTVEDSWAPWVNEQAIPAVQYRLKNLPAVDSPSASPAQIREVKGLKALLDGLKLVAAELEADPKAWVFDGYDQGLITFKPVRVTKWGQQMVWDHGKRFLLMSGTTISAQEIAESCGLNEPYATVTVPMSFPVENRPIRVVPVAEMSNKHAETAWPKMADAINLLLAFPEHEGQRVLIHTVSYKLADYLWGRIRQDSPMRPVFRYGNAGEKDEALRKYLQTPGAVLVAPSMDRGVDLPGDACRVMVVAKIPYPNLGDRQVSKRLHTNGGQEWYSVQTVRSLVQMTGRGVRSAEDRAVTYLLDGQFMSSIWRKSRMLLPAWWTEALDFRVDARRFIKAKVT